MARQLVRMAGAEQIARRLLELEGQIPAEQGLSSQSFELWHAWRRAVKRSESAAELLPQVSNPPLSQKPGLRPAALLYRASRGEASLKNGRAINRACLPAGHEAEKRSYKSTATFLLPGSLWQCSICSSAWAFVSVGLKEAMTPEEACDVTRQHGCKRRLSSHRSARASSSLGSFLNVSHEEVQQVLA